MALTVSVEAAQSPVTLDDFKAHARITSTDEDGDLIRFVKAATNACEIETRRAFVTRTYKLYLDAFPLEDEIKLPMPPLASVASITYYDVDNALQTLAASVYEVDAVSTPARVRLKHDQVWTATYDKMNAVVITFDAGYGTRLDVPNDIRAAINIMAAHLYENREMLITGTIVAVVPRSVASLLGPYRMWDF